MPYEELILQYDVFNWYGIIALILAGFSVGIINTIAGSGTIITYSFFMFLGLPANICNGTIRLGVIMQTLASTLTFYKNNVLVLKKGLYLSIPVVIGSIIGAKIAVQIDKELFELIVAIVMLVMLVFIFYKPENWIKGRKELSETKPKASHYLIYLLIGVYGGFIHIGVGIFMLATLVLVSGYDLVKANAIKVMMVFLYSPFALIMFILHDQVHFMIGTIAAIGNLIGGIVASHFAVKKGAAFVRWVLMLVIIGFSIKVLGGMFW